MDAWNRNIPFFQNEVGKVYKDRRINVLEIGSYEGKSARWMCENIITHPESRLYCLDLWEKNPQHQEVNFSEVERRFDSAVKPYKNKVIKIKGDSSKTILQLDKKFHLIYIDGDHSAQAVLRDLVLSWPLLEIGGTVVCDDYVWKENLEAWGKGHRDYHPLATPKIAVDAFTLIYSDKLRHWVSYNQFGIVAFVKISD